MDLARNIQNFNRLDKQGDLWISKVPTYDLLKETHSCNSQVGITNYGTGWWTASQSLSQLIVLLRQGRYPHAVIFYDGINDIDVVTFGGKAGGISPDAETLLNMGLTQNFSFAAAMVSSSAFLRSLIGRLQLRNIYNPFSLRPEVMEELAQQVVQKYERTVRLVVTLGKEYGFKTNFFWQPYPLISRKRLYDEERSIIGKRREVRQWEIEFARKVYAAIVASDYLNSNASFHNLADVFEADSSMLFVDSEHLLPNGNQKIAVSMLQRMELCD